MSKSFASLARGAIVTLVGIVASKAFLIVFELTLAGSLSPAEFGVYMICIALIAVLAAISQLGIGYAAIQSVVLASERGDSGAVTSSARIGVIVPTLVSMVFACALFAFADPIATEFFGKDSLAEPLAVASLSIPFLSFCMAANAVLRGLRRMSDAIITFDGLRNCVLVLSLPAILLGVITPLEALWAQAVANALAAAFGLYRLRDRLFARVALIDRATLSQMMGFARPLVVWSIVQRASRELSVVIAGVALTEAQVGIFALAMRFVLILNMTQNAVNAAAPAEMASLWGAGRMAEMAALYRRAARGLLTVSSVLAVPVLVGVYPLFAIFGPAYLEHAWILWPLMAEKLLTVGSGPAGSVFIACDRRAVMVRLAFLSLGLQLLLTLPLAVGFGLPGLVAGATLRGIVVLAFTQVALQRHFGFHAFTRRLNVIAVDIVVAIAVGATIVWGSTDPMRYMLAICVAFAVLGGLFILNSRDSLAEVAGPLRRVLVRRLGKAR